MAAFVEVNLVRVTCIDKETSSDTHDVFALSGAVVADGTTHAFTREAVPLKSNTTFSYHQKVFSGWVEGDSIGIGALGLDLDNSDGWTKSEDDVRKITGAIAKAAGYLPVPYIGKVIEAIPDAIDFFTDRDENDEVFRWAEEIPLEVLAPGAHRTRQFEPRTRGEKTAGPISISDWDYSVMFTVTWQQPYPGFQAVEPIEWSSRPEPDSQFGQWYGVWESHPSTHVRCVVSRNAGDPRLLDIVTIESLPTGKVETTTVGAKIVGLSVEIDVHEVFEDGSSIGDLIGALRGSSPGVAVHTRFAGGVLVEKQEGIDVEGVVLTTVPAPVHTPLVIPLAGDRVELDNGCILEMRRAFADGVDTGYKVLRYVGPARAHDIITSAPVDLELEHPLDLN